MSLLRLAAEAQALANSHPCAALGHRWVSIGGRPCPRNPGAYCSQTVFQCALCEDFDYGEPGGPAHRECIVTGPCDVSCSSDLGSEKHNGT